MISALLKKIFGSRNDRLLKQYMGIVQQINRFEPALAALSDNELSTKTQEFKRRLQEGTSLNELLPETFAVCREAAKRVLQMRHFDVQLIGGIVLYQGKIAEMRTGEGKTLMSTLAAYLHALAGEGVHVVTVNDYLAERDAAEMGKLFRFLGLSVGVNLSQMSHPEKIAAYQADITYGTNNEFGFDYLRDNMVFSPSERVQRPLSFAIVDEVDSILIDEARTPLIISGPAEDNLELYQAINKVVPKLKRQETEDGEGDFWVDEKSNQVLLSEAGHDHAEKLLIKARLLPPGESLYAPAHIGLMHHLNAALRAHNLFHRDQQYVVVEDEVVIVDEFTGRLMAGRRWSDGLHQAVEAKEGVTIHQENQTLATITLQNYFRMYKKLSGMTGTADTEAYEFQQIYGLETVIIPTNKPMIRIDKQDQVYRTAQEKYQAIIADVKDCQARSQPTLVGTTSIEQSELLSHLLSKEKLPHNVLNAKQHAKEADIIAQAGRPGMITIATNMAGRGTDIVLGGNIVRQITDIENNTTMSADEKVSAIVQLRAEWEQLHDQVLKAGGLHIIGTERHESRRIDNQLRGRSGRQGDPGSSRFYLSLEDPLLRIFAGDRVAMVMDRLKMPAGEPIEAGMVSRAIESAQRKVEGRNFDIRKQLLEYDDVSNEQRKAIYQQRNHLLETDDISDITKMMRVDMVTELFALYLPQDSMEEQWDIAGFERALQELGVLVSIGAWLKLESTLDREEILRRCILALEESYQAKVALVGKEMMNQFEHAVLLQYLDQHWREHLSALDQLRQGIHLRGYAQKNPRQEYKREAFELFADLLDRVKRDVVQIIMTVKIQSSEEVAQVEAAMHEMPAMQFIHQDAESSGQTQQSAPISRNGPCPCGSGKKYKLCHGKL